MSANRFKGGKGGDVQVLFVKNLVTEHNHDIGPEHYRMYARNRTKLDKQEQTFVNNALALKVLSTES